MAKPILCLDFDGVINSYSSGWQGATIIPDPPVPGAMEFIHKAMESFRVAIFSSRSNQPGGIEAMQDYLVAHMAEYLVEAIGDSAAGPRMAYLAEHIEWPTTKPAAFLTIDDRALTFDGTWPNIPGLLLFKPWNKR